MPVEIEVHIIPMIGSSPSNPPQAAWQIWVEEYGVYIAEYRYGTLSIEPELPAVIVEALSVYLDALMTQMNPGYEPEDLFTMTPIDPDEPPPWPEA